MRLPGRLTPLRFVGALLRARPGLAASSCALGAISLLPSALLPLVVGDAVEAIGTHRPLGGSILLIVAFGIAQAVLSATLIFAVHGMWIHGATTSQRTIAEHTARLGASLRAQAATGDVMAISSSDIGRMGNVLEVFGRLVGATMAFLVIGAVLVTISPVLGSIALAGIPLAVLGLGKLVAPLQRRKR